jgi:uncharacterized protein YgbK (DUF1537 family)
MAEWAVVADDLTGANTAGVLLTTKGFRTLTTIEHRNLSRFSVDDYDAIVVNAASRTLDAAEAYTRVKECTEELIERGFERFSKRIDSTIRGNLGAEIQGMLDAVSDKAVACVVAVYPASGRMVIGGYQLVNGVPVHKTAAGTDPIKPVQSSILAEEIARQTVLPQGLIKLATVLEGSQAIAAAVEQEIQGGKRILLFDAISFDDIGAIAQAMDSLDVSWIAVDPGPFTAQICDLAFSRKPRVIQKKGGKVFIVAGSASDLTRAQLAHLETDGKAEIINVDVHHFLDSEEEQPLEDEIAAKIWESSKKTDIFGLCAASDISMMLDIKQEAMKRGITTDDITRRITYALARIARKTLARQVPELKGIYLTGGDMTVAFCQAAGVEAIELIEEIQPHISYGILLGGPMEGVYLTTKGGLIGDTGTALMCAKYMLSH